MQSGVPNSVSAPRYRRVWIILALSIVLIALMSAFLSRSLETLDEDAAWVSHSERVRFELAQILQTLSDLGTGVAGYQLTHDTALFEPAHIAAAAIDSEFANLGRLLAADPAQRPLLDELGNLVKRRKQETEEQRSRAMRGDVAGVEAEIASGEARRLMDGSRSVIAKMQQAEKQLRDEHRVTARSAYQDLAFAIWAAAAVAVALLVAITFVTIRDAERLREVQEELATTLRSVGDAVIATDRLGSVRFLNAVAEQLTGWSNHLARGRPLTEVFSIINEHTRETVESPVSRVLRENAVVGLANHTILRSRDGTERPIEDSGAPIQGSNGAITGVVLVFRDATAERTARLALIESANALREADQRKDVFLATLSHELRNPLAPIRTATRVLETVGLTAAEVERSRSIISRQVRHMSALLDDLLDISRITRGVLNLKYEAVDLRGLIEAAVETAQPAIQAKRHTLAIEYPDRQIAVEVDPVRLTQVIANLLTNAAKYTDPEGSITLGAGASTEHIRLFVRDNGIGIARDMLHKVFEMFSQIDAGHEHSDGGIGIGLALVKGFVELHGGTVEARSAGLNRGSEFIVTLPASLVREDTSATTYPRQPEMTTTKSIQTVLVADDNRDGAEIMGMLLEQSGYRVVLAHTGPEAFSVAAEHRPSIAVLDIGMPGLSGYELARRLRAEAWGAPMLLIAVTGWGQDEDKRKALDAGFDHHLTKPIDPDALEKLMNDFVAASSPRPRDRPSVRRWGTGLRCGDHRCRRRRPDGWAQAGRSRQAGRDFGRS